MQVWLEVPDFSLAKYHDVSEVKAATKSELKHTKFLLALLLHLRRIMEQEDASSEALQLWRLYKIEACLNSYPKEGASMWFPMAL